MQTPQCPIIDHKTLDIYGVLVAAGSGSRAGVESPKQYRTFLGHPVFVHALKAMLSHRAIKQIAVVHPKNDTQLMQSCLTAAGLTDDQRIVLVAGGTNRSESVRNGVLALRPSNNCAILIHDAARPGLTASVIDTLWQAIRNHHGAAPAIPVVDALKKLRTDGHISSISRDGLYRIQTPQIFRASAILPLILSTSESTADEFQLAEQARLSLTFTEGSENLGKLTYPEDFQRMEKLLSNTVFRSGLGYDVHAFEDGDAVMLCGVSVPHEKKLKGHSDADVGWHALTDALLGALAAGDIGDHFPPSDPQWKGAPSSTFLKHAANLVKARGGQIINVDVTLICEAPKIKPHRETMQKVTADLLELDPSQVSIKATTTEKLGFEGRKEGISAQALATIEIPLATRQLSNSE